MKSSISVGRHRPQRLDAYEKMCRCPLRRYRGNGVSNDPSRVVGENETKNGKLDSAIEIRDAIRKHFNNIRPGSLGGLQKRNSLKGNNGESKEKHDSVAEFSIVGPVDLERLRKGSKIYANREYEWVKVPDELRDWHFTRHEIRTGKTYEINVRRAGAIVVCFATTGGLQRTQSYFNEGWTRVFYEFDTSFDEGEHGPIFAKKQVTRGMVRLPLGHPHSGTILFVPPKRDIESRSIFKPGEKFIGTRYPRAGTRGLPFEFGITAIDDRKFSGYVMRPNDLGQHVERLNANGTINGQKLVFEASGSRGQRLSRVRIKYVGVRLEDEISFEYQGTGGNGTSSYGTAKVKRKSD